MDHKLQNVFENHKILVPTNELKAYCIENNKSIKYIVSEKIAFEFLSNIGHHFIIITLERVLVYKSVFEVYDLRRPNQKRKLNYIN